MAAAIIVTSAIAEPPGWYRAFAALSLLGLAAQLPRIGDISRAAAVAAMAPVGSLVWASCFGIVVLVGNKVATSCAAGGRRAANSFVAVSPLLLAAAAAAVAAKQGVASTVLASAGDGGFVALAAGIGLVAALVWGGRRRATGLEVLPMLAAALLIGGNTVGVLAIAPLTFAESNGATHLSPAVVALEARIKAAAAVDAIPIWHDTLVADAKNVPSMLQYLVGLAPTRDEAAALLPVEDALDAGWRPRKAEGRTVEVAQALWKRGRGGEATRLLKRFPRFGEVDATLALFERREGAPSGWRGGVTGTVLPGQAAFGRPGRLWATGSREFVVTAAAPLSKLALEFSGQNYEGAPLVDVKLDEGNVRRVEVGEPLWLDLGPVEAGVHYIQISFLNDRFGPTGDRNVVLSRIEGVE